MRILITGANGFIAREIIARLATSGHEIIACVHHQLLASTPYSNVYKIDFKQAKTPEYWMPYLSKIDAVINCAGVFQTTKQQTMWAIHYDAPRALFDACVIQGIKKIIQISALGIEKVDTPYAKSKLAAEEYLHSLDLNSVVIRPGLVYGKGSYGGTSLFRGLAGLPWVIPLPGDAANQVQQPIHIDDLSLIVEKSLSLSGKQVLCAVGEEKINVKELLVKLRSWLGFKKALLIKVPNFLILLGSKIGNFIPNSPLSDTGVKMLAVDNCASDTEFNDLVFATEFKPRAFSFGLKGMVSSVQDRWHARLYFLKPLLRLTIAFIWIFSGVVSILPVSSSQGFELLTEAKIPLTLQPFALYSLAIIDILLGVATLFNYRLLLIGSLQVSFICFYTVLITVLLPQYWLDPFAPIAKNIPIMMAVFIMMALESDR